MGWARLGRAVIDSTRVKASASRDRVDTEQKLRNERAKLRRQVRRWQKACDRDDSEPGGLKVAIRLAEEKLAKMPRRLERLRKTGMQKLSRTDEDARFLRPRGQSFELGYRAEIAVSDDPLILAQLSAALGAIEVVPTEDLGLPGDAKEAFIFAVLADETMHGRPANLPSATGAKRPAILGKICYPPPR